MKSSNFSQHIKGLGKCIFSLIIFLLLAVSGYAQKSRIQKKLDSLFLVNQKHVQTDSVKVVILTEIYRQYLNQKNTEKVEEYIDKAVLLAQKLKLRNLSGFGFYRKAKFYHGKAVFIKAEENYYNAIAEFTLGNNLDMVAGTYLNLGALYTAIPDYAKCLEVNQKAISIYEKLDNEVDLASCYTNLAGIYQDLGNQSQSLIYLKMALKVFFKEGENSRGVAVVNELMGMAYFSASKDELGKMGILQQDRLSLALIHFQKSAKIAEVLSDSSIMSTTKKNLGNVYNELGRKDLALSAYQQAISISKDLDDQENYLDCLYSLGKYYQNEGDLNNAVQLYNTCFKIAHDNNFLDLKKNAAFGLSDTYEKLKNYDKSLEFYKSYIQAKEQIFDQDKEKEITRRQMQIDFGLKEKDYVYKQKITDVELQRQVLLATQRQQQLYLKRQELALSDKEKSLQRLTFLKKQVDLEMDREIQSNNFERTKLKARYDTSLRDKQISRQQQQIKFDWRVKIFLIVAITLVLLIAIVIFYNQRRATRLNKVINAQKRELEQLSKVKDRIFSVVSHDMRTPVNSLISFIQLLEDGNIDQEKLKRYAASLKNSLTYTSSMMENLLNWAASQMQGFNPYLESLNVNEIIFEVINSSQHHAENKGIAIENKIPNDTLCKADSNMFSLVIRNILGNAIKFTPQQGLIKISVKDFTKELHIIIADNGVGLSPENLNHFNKPGYSGAGISTLGTEKEKGTGLGLMLCRTFIGLMDGKISASANVPNGTIFNIILPK